MLYITIATFVGIIISLFLGNGIWVFVSGIVFILCSLVILFLNHRDDIIFEEKVASTSKKETKKLIYPLDMSAEKPNKYFIIPRKDNAYHLYVKTKTGFEQTEYDIDKTELKQYNEEYPNACVVETVTTTEYQYTPRYKKFLYYGIVFACSTNMPAEIKEKTTYTLYVPQNTIVQ